MATGIPARPHPDVLSEALVRAQWSGRDLAKAINPRLNAMGHPTVDATTPYKWLKGHLPQSSAVRDVVAVVLTENTSTRYTSAELWGCENPVEQTHATQGLLGPLELSDVLRAASDWTSGTIEPAMVRSTTAETLTAAVWDATRQRQLASVAGHTGGEFVAPEYVDMLFEQLAALRRLDDRTGGGPLSQRQARIALHETLTLIHTARYTPETGTRLLQHAAGAAQVAGWMSFDAALSPAAHRYQLLAIRIARAAGDTTTVCNALGMLAYQHAANADPSLALRFAQAAVEHANRSLPLVRARAFGRLATAYAAAGDLEGFRRATERCRRLTQQRHSDDPPSLYYLTDQQIDAESGQALVDLAAHLPSQRTVLLREAADLLAPITAQGPEDGFRRSGILHGIHLVRASVGARDPEATAHWIGALAPHVSHVQSVRCRELLTSVRSKAGRQLRAAKRADALEALDAALSKV